MFGNDHKIWLAAGLLIVLASNAVRADVVVVSSDTPDYQPGTLLGDSVGIRLAAGTSITVIAESGKHRVITGPYSGTHGLGAAKHKQSRTLTVLASLVRTTVRDTKSVGAIRNAPGSERPIFAIDWRFSGVHCFVNAAELELWRPRPRGTTIATISSPNGQTENVSWQSGSYTVDWPSDLNIVAGASYQIGRKGSEFSKNITLRKLPDSERTTVQRAIWMAENGCRVQAARFLAALK